MSHQITNLDCRGKQKFYIYYLSHTPLALCQLRQQQQLRFIKKLACVNCFLYSFWKPSSIQFYTQNETQQMEGGGGKFNLRKALFAILYNLLSILIYIDYTKNSKDSQRRSAIYYNPLTKII